MIQWKGAQNICFQVKRMWSPSFDTCTDCVTLKHISCLISNCTWTQRALIPLRCRWRHSPAHSNECRNLMTALLRFIWTFLCWQSLAPHICFSLHVRQLRGGFFCDFFQWFFIIIIIRDSLHFHSLTYDTVSYMWDRHVSLLWNLSNVLTVKLTAWFPKLFWETVTTSNASS